MNDETCNDDGGRGIGAGHVCHCLMLAGHAGRHGCHCGAMWKTEQKEGS